LISYHFGDHELDDCRHLVSDLVKRLNNKPYFVSDELEHYSTVLFENFHDETPVSKTGKRGRPRLPEKIVHNDLAYATVKKTRKE
jgi:hypothetical protein